MIKTFKDIDNLSPSNFEVFVKDIFETAGWSDAIITKIGKEFKHGDGGVDIFAYKGGRKFAIEVKQRSLNYTVDVTALNQLVTGAQLANVKNKILVTNSYFTSEVRIRALKLGVELIDRDELQNLWVIKHSEIGRDIKPRKYQKDVINEALKQYSAGKSKLLIEMATGLGKTYTVAHLLKKIIQKKEETPKILFLAHQIEILLQSVTAFKNVLGVGNYSFSACFSGSKPEKTDFVFASFDTLYGQVSELSERSFEFIIVDEAHHTPAKTYSEVVKRFKPELMIGLTATPYRTDNKDVLSFFGGSEGHIGKFDLIWALKHKKLAFPRYLVFLDNLDQKLINQLESRLSISDLDKRLFLHNKEKEVVRIINETIKEKEIKSVKGIVFCKNIKYMKYLISFFEFGTATLVHSQMSDQVRRENIRNFREGSFKYILVCDLFNEGIDIPETNLLVFMRYTKSRTVWLQQLGRGLRKTPNKEYVYVLDFVGSLERLNEIKSFSQSVNNQPIDRKNLIDDHGEKSYSDFFHDTSLTVEYSAEAAKVLALIENMKMRLNSREALIEKIKKYKLSKNCIPKISNIEKELDDVSLDQIATHFGSYYCYLTSSFGSEFEKDEIINRINYFIKKFNQENKLNPSPRNISLEFMYKNLYEISEKEINNLGSSIFFPNTPTLNASKKKQKIISSKKENNCTLINKLKYKISSRSDIRKLTPSEQREIKEKYQSISIFLKVINDES